MDVSPLQHPLQEGRKLVSWSNACHICDIHTYLLANNSYPAADSDVLLVVIIFVWSVPLFQTRQLLSIPPQPSGSQQPNTSERSWGWRIMPVTCPTTGAFGTSSHYISSPQLSPPLQPTAFPHSLRVGKLESLGAMGVMLTTRPFNRV